MNESQQNYSTTRQILLELAKRASRIARRCEQRETRRKFERIARFLERAGRGGVR